MADRKAAAFFDFDRTLFKRECARVGVDHLRRMRRLRVVPTLRALCANQLYKRHLLNEGPMLGVVLRLYAGLDSAELDEAGPRIYEREIKAGLATNVLERMEGHRRDGHLLVIVSAAIPYLVEPAARDLRVSHLLCTRMEVGVDGRFTGRARGPICAGDTKRVLVEKLAAEVGIDLERSFAYGNHQSDLAMLSAVGHPAAVNPTGKLREIALARGWPIIEFE